MAENILDNRPTGQKEQLTTKQYPYQVFRNGELRGYPEVVEKIRSMLLVQPVDRFRSRFPKFPIHENPSVIKNQQKLSVRLKKKDASQTSYTDGYIEEICFDPGIVVVTVFDEKGDIAVLADAYPDRQTPSTMNADIIRAQGSLPGDSEVSTFAFRKLYDACFQDPSVDKVTAYVHRSNDRSRRRLMTTLEFMEQEGYPAYMHDGMYLHPGADKPSNHWRGYTVTRRTNS